MQCDQPGVIRQYVFNPQTHHQEAGLGGDLHVVEGAASSSTLEDISRLAVVCFFSLSKHLPNLSVRDQEDLREWHRAVALQMEMSASFLNDEQRGYLQEIFDQMNGLRMDILCALSSIPRWQEKLMHLRFDELTRGNVIRAMFPQFGESADFFHDIQEQVSMKTSDYKWFNTINQGLETFGFDVDRREAIIADLNLCLLQNLENPWDCFAEVLSQHKGLEGFVAPVIEMMQRSYEELCLDEVDDLTGRMAATTLA